MKKSLKIVLFVLVISLVLTITFTKRFIKEKKVDVANLIEQSVDKLVNNQYVEYDFSYYCSGYLKDKEIPLYGTVKVAPKTVNGDAFGFHSALVTANTSDEKPSFQLSKINDHVFFYKNGNEDVEHSPIHRLGAPLYSMHAKNTMLLYQYLPILKDYKNYGPTLGEVKKINGKKCAEIKFDITEHDFFVRFWINIKDFEIVKITNLLKDGNNNSTLEYNINNLKFLKTTNKNSFDIDQKIPRKEFSTGGPVVGAIAPEFKLHSFKENKIIGISNFKDTILVIDFWATWCKPCVDLGMPALQKLSEKYRGEPVTFLGVTYKEKSDPEAFISKFGYTYNFAHGTDEVGLLYGIDKIGLPTYFIIDKTKKIVEFESGFQGDSSTKRIENTLDSLLSK